MSELTDKVMAISTAILATGVAFAAASYVEEQHIARLQRTVEFLLPTYTEDEQQRIAMFEEFPDRWEIPMKAQLPPKEAQRFFDASANPNSKDYYRWDVARRHLNHLEPLAFAYCYDLGDQKVIAANACPTMKKSYHYFQKLIDLFSLKFGSNQSWQFIKKAVVDMDKRYAQECETHEDQTLIALVGLDASAGRGKRVPISCGQ
jgi:hypothetical protein